jgi:hypothetical protein
MTREPLIAEDVLLLLFDPSSGTIAGEGTLYYVLGGALLTELALDGRIDIDDKVGWKGRLVHPVGTEPPADPLLRDVWDRLVVKPRDVQTLLAVVGPPLRAAILDRVAERGDIIKESRKTLGLFTTTALRDGGTARRAGLLQQVRAVLADGVTPAPRIAGIAALLSASGSLPALHREIPWSGPVIERATELQRGDWGAGAAGAAVARTVTATITGSMIAAGVITGNN